ncbi:MAG TPA: hypothetical protein PLX85_03495 [Dehalococcoidia bacterium]|nr:hypothetical protein [Dehalococcoidia bacterium]
MLTSKAGSEAVEALRRPLHAGVLARSEVVVAVALVAGLVVRLYYLVPAGGFPLNDGGLFYSMARDLQAHDFITPARTSYNLDAIPYAYPPLMVYAIALLDRFTPIDLITSLRFLPALASLATIPVFYALARKLLPGTSASAAAIAFAVLVEGFHWHIMGGGITRAFGLLFALLAIQQAVRLFIERDGRGLLPVIGWASAAQLTHPNLVAPIAIGLIVLLHGRSRPALKQAAIVAGSVLVLTAWWWGALVLRDGAGTFLALRASRFSEYFYHDGYPWRALLDWSFTTQPVLNWPAALALIGAAALIARGAYLVPLWLVAEFVLEPTQAHNFLPAPVALLVGAGVGLVVLPALTRPWAFEEPEAPAAWRRWARPRWGLGSRIATTGFVTVLGVIALSSALAKPELPALRSLSGDERANLEWIARETPADARFLVVSGQPWWADGLSEWFPALTGRHSDYTAQGYEWLGVEFPNRIYWHDRLQGCGGEDASCLDDVVVRSQSSYDYVYVRTNCCGELRDAILSSTRFRVVRQNEAGIIAVVVRQALAS